MSPWEAAYAVEVMSYNVGHMPIGDIIKPLYIYEEGSLCSAAHFDRSQFLKVENSMPVLFLALSQGPSHHVVSSDRLTLLGR